MMGWLAYVEYSLQSLAMKYAGGCHCGKVKFNVEMDVKMALDCNCSICSKRGALLDFTTPDNFKLLSGENELTEYKFNRHVIQHLFCSTCGILSFSRGKDDKGKEMIAINIRCLDNFDFKKVPVHEYDGKSK